MSLLWRTGEHEDDWHRSHTLNYRGRAYTFDKFEPVLCNNSRHTPFWFCTNELVNLDWPCGRKIGSWRQHYVIIVFHFFSCINYVVSLSLSLFSFSSKGLAFLVFSSSQNLLFPLILLWVPFAMPQFLHIMPTTFYFLI